MTGSRRPRALLAYHFFHPDDVVSARLFSDSRAGAGRARVGRDGADERQGLEPSDAPPSEEREMERRHRRTDAPAFVGSAAPRGASPQLRLARGVVGRQSAATRALRCSHRRLRPGIRAPSARSAAPHLAGRGSRSLVLRRLSRGHRGRWRWPPFAGARSSRSRPDGTRLCLLRRHRGSRAPHAGTPLHVRERCDPRDNCPLGPGRIDRAIRGTRPRHALGPVRRRAPRAPLLRDHGTGPRLRRLSPSGTRIAGSAWRRCVVHLFEPRQQARSAPT